MSGGATPFDFPDRCTKAGLLDWDLCYLVLSQSMGDSHLMPRLEVCTGVLRIVRGRVAAGRSSVRKRLSVPLPEMLKRSMAPLYMGDRR